MPDLTPLSPFGLTTPRHATHGSLTLSEMTGLALYSVALAQGVNVPRPFDLTLPDVGGLVVQGDWLAFWTGPAQWMLSCPDGAAIPDCTGCAVTDQSDGWVTLDLRAPDAATLERVLEKLINLDLRRFQAGQARRTGLAHLAAFVLRLDVGHMRILGPRSAAGTLWHALDTAARQNSAPLHT